MAISSRDTDKVLIISTLFLAAAGVVMVYSTSYILAMKKFGDGFFFFKKHLVYAGIGLVFFIAASRSPYTFYKKFTYPILLVAALGLIAVFIPHVGFSAGGAKRWVRLGPLAFQPSEPAKLAVIFFLAYSLSSKAEKIKNFVYGFLPNVVIPGVIIALIMLEPDLGTAVCLSLVVMTMLFIAGARITHIGAIALAAAPVILLMINRFAYMAERIKIFLDPWKYPEGKGFQMVQSFIAFGNGGVVGVGLGEGKQKLFYLPEAHTDFILSVIGEETGLIGVGAVMFGYLAFFYCGIRIALKAKDLYARYLALGVTLMITLQAAVNMGVVLGAMPPKGIPLPFISYGGTSLIIAMTAAGILLNIFIKENSAYGRPRG
ncbi:MAG: putative lipid II flippase FtsW [Deltaproteobacteria bacterium]|nr:putative lipid II flippase FtsW [Deltaproteobacteria bacterium]